VDVAECVHPGMEADYSPIALSRVAKQRRQGDITQQLKFSLRAKVNGEGSLVTLALHKSTTRPNNYSFSIFTFRVV